MGIAHAIPTLRPSDDGAIASPSGAANVFCGDQPKAGRRLTKPTPNRPSPRLADSLLEIVAGFPAVDTISLALDHLNFHNRTALVNRFGEKIGAPLWGRFPVQSTQKHDSWLNPTEIEIALSGRQRLGQRGIPILGELRREARA